ncbi:MAG: hypothetical protein IKP32_07650 [Clostridia bacterium]|nr:hypothetical protein [Clostridia bacterium]
MSNDISKYVEQIVAKLTGNSGMIEKFKSNPAKVVTDILGVKLDGNILKSVIEAVKSKLNLTDVAKNAGGFLAKLKSFFTGGKK